MKEPNNQTLEKNSIKEFGQGSVRSFTRAKRKFWQIMARVLLFNGKKPY
jgi:hypothetical protein